jgi:acyl phosphate:glycerol-3-phosphate acyltransferase
MNWISLLSIPLAYILGSTPSAYIIARLSGKIDIRDEVDGRISAAAVFRRVGPLPFLMVVVLDIGKSALAVLIAEWLGADPLIVILVGIVAIAGHQWSMFLKFQGGLGATVIGGALGALALFPTLIGAAVAALLAAITRKSSLSFGIGIITVVIALFSMQWLKVPSLKLLVPASVPPPPTAYHLLIVFPAIVGLMMIIKALQIRYNPGAALTNKMDMDK